MQQKAPSVFLRQRAEHCDRVANASLDAITFGVALYLLGYFALQAVFEDRGVPRFVIMLTAQAAIIASFFKAFSYSIISVRAVYIATGSFIPLTQLARAVETCVLLSLLICLIGSDFGLGPVWANVLGTMLVMCLTAATAALAGSFKIRS